MKYDFDKVTDREGTACAKWDMREEVFGEEDILPMWVADADWPTAPEIIEALKKRVDHGVFGYSHLQEEHHRAVVDWVKKRYDWEIEPEWLIYTNGVVPSIEAAIKAFSHRGDEVVIQPPVYYPFYTAIKNCGTQVANNELKQKDEHYEMDFDNLRSLLERGEGKRSGPPRHRLLILCSPHNPVGRVWSPEELKKLGQITTEHDLTVISDEIHADLTFSDFSHTPFASLSEEFAKNSITTISPSKTFNLASLKASIMIVPDEKKRKRINQVAGRGLNSPNVLGLEAMKAAYEKGEEWLEEQLSYLQDNLHYTENFINSELPSVGIFETQGTYLVWLDFSSLGMEEEKLEEFMIEEARVGLDFGSWFGPGGEGFMRLNVACPRNILKEGLGSIKDAVKGL